MKESESVFESLDLRDVHFLLKSKLEAAGKKNVHIYFSFENSCEVNGAILELLNIDAHWDSCEEWD